MRLRTGGCGGNGRALHVDALASVVLIDLLSDGTVRIWRLAGGTPPGKPLTGHTGAVAAVGVGTLPDATPVIVSGGYGDATVRVWQPADGTQPGPPLLSRRDIAVHGNVIATATGPDRTSPSTS